MNNPWDTHLKADPIPWLLEPENPSVRYWTLTDLLDWPTDDEIQEARAAIAGQPLVREILERQGADGHWGDDETKPYTARGAVGVLGVLHLLGVEPDEQRGREELVAPPRFLEKHLRLCLQFGQALFNGGYFLA